MGRRCPFVSNDNDTTTASNNNNDDYNVDYYNDGMTGRRAIAVERVMISPTVVSSIPSECMLSTSGIYSGKETIIQLNGVILVRWSTEFYALLKKGHFNHIVPIARNTISDEVNKIKFKII